MSSDDVLQLARRIMMIAVHGGYTMGRIRERIVIQDAVCDDAHFMLAYMASKRLYREAFPSFEGA